MSGLPAALDVEEDADVLGADGVGVVRVAPKLPRRCDVVCHHALAAPRWPRGSGGPSGAERWPPGTSGRSSGKALSQIYPPGCASSTTTNTASGRTSRCK